MRLRLVRAGSWRKMSFHGLSNPGSYPCFQAAKVLDRLWCELDLEPHFWLYYSQNVTV